MSQASRFTILILLVLSFLWADLANAGPKEGANFYSLNSTASLIQEYEKPDRDISGKSQLRRSQETHGVAAPGDGPIRDELGRSRNPPEYAGFALRS